MTSRDMKMLLLILSTVAMCVSACEEGSYFDMYSRTCQPCRVCSDREQTMIVCTADKNTACLPKNWFYEARAINAAQAKKIRDQSTIATSTLASTRDPNAVDILLILMALLPLVLVISGLITWFYIRARRHGTWVKLSTCDDIYVLPLTSEEKLKVVNTYVKLDRVT